ncbi:hypothetical protein Hanom_Chr15g01411901 [Helianthus anomalus]
MAPGKDNMSLSVSVLTQHQLDRFVREYRIPMDLRPVLPSENETIYPFRKGKFPFYTCVWFCNFSRFIPFGLSRISHFELSCRAQDRRPDLNVFRYFYEFITAGD